MMIHRRSRPTVEERSKKATPSAVGVAHYAPLGAAGIMALIGPFCKPHVQRGVMIIKFLYSLGNNPVVRWNCLEKLSARS